MKLRSRKSSSSSEPAARVCSSCSSDISPEWTTCRICGAVIAGGMTRSAPSRVKRSFNDNFNHVMRGVNNESRGLWGPEPYDPRDGQPK